MNAGLTCTTSRERQAMKQFPQARHGCRLGILHHIIRVKVFDTVMAEGNLKVDSERE